MSGNEGDDGHEEHGIWIQKQSRYARSSEQRCNEHPTANSVTRTYMHCGGSSRELSSRY